MAGRAIAILAKSGFGVNTSAMAAQWAERLRFCAEHVLAEASFYAWRRIVVSATK